jgi:arylsulfatase
MKRRLAVAVGVVTVACGGGRKAVVHDLAALAGVAERWSRHEVILFGTPAAQPHQVEGFHAEAATGDAEPFAWTKREALLSLTWPEARDRAAVLDAAPFAAAKGQSVEVWLNGTRVDGFALNDERHRYRVKLPAPAQRPGENRLVLRFARIASPADQDPTSADRRELAAALYSLTVGGSSDAALDDLLRRDAPRPYGRNPGAPSLVLIGPSVVRYALRVPEGAELRFVPKLYAAARAAAGAASFRVTLQTSPGDEREIWSRSVGSRDGDPGEVSLRLGLPAGTLVHLGLHVGGAGEARFAWGLWEAPRVLGSGPAPVFEAAPFSAQDDARADALRRTVAGANVLFIILDAARARQFGTYGYSRATTPEIDRIAQEGVVFERAFTPAAYTLGAMSSVWTSQPAHLHHSAVSFSSRLPSQTLTLTELLSASGVVSVGFVANAMAGTGFGLDRGFGEFHEVFKQRSDADALRAGASAWLASQRGRFFAYLHFREPHFPFDPPPPFDTRFGPDGPLPKALRRDQQWITDVNQGRRAIAPAELEHLVRLYDGNLAAVDQEVGRLRQALERANLWNNTIVILAADHGESLREHGFIGHNVQLYDETVQIPLIVRLPGGPAGLRLTGLVDLLDIAPTLADVFGVRGQRDSDREFRGRSLLPVIAGAPGKPAVLSRTVWDRPIYSIRDEGFKFIHDTRTGLEELYDLSADPGERHNVVEGHVLRAAFYRQSLYRWIAEAARRRGGSDEQAQLTSEQCANFRALGYVSVAGCR